MGYWRCGRCTEHVNIYGWRQRGEKPCNCTSGASPWWWIPTRFIEKVRCAMGICLMKGTCNRCDKGPF